MCWHQSYKSQHSFTDILLHFQKWGWFTKTFTSEAIVSESEHNIATCTLENYACQSSIKLTPGLTWEICSSDVNLHNG